MAKISSWHNSFDIDGDPTEGGNANVYFVKDKGTDEKYALKELMFKKNKEKQIRFTNEIRIAKENADSISGIIPIIYSCDEEYWYTMPIAKLIINYVADKDVANIIDGVIKLSETLESLHAKNISHRDIKPANIYYYNGRFCFGDFGLVDFPDNFDDLTRDDRGLGAIFTIAPEMKRNPKEADGKKADVFSLAKTMWMLLSRDEKGFDGVYNYLDANHSLRYLNAYKDTHTVEIDEVLREATDNNPDLRPTIKEFKKRLILWRNVYADPDKSQASDWNFLNKQLFGLNSPESSIWRKADKIIEVLNVIGNTPAYNHMLFHDKGGLDFSRAEKSAEDGCIKLHDTIGFCYLVKPKALYFEGFDKNYRWNYFLLELDNLNPIFENNNFSDKEYLVEDTPAHYVSAQSAQYGVYDYDVGNRFPEGYKIVYRYTKGKLLIVLKNGPYNGIKGTYDGRHGDCSANEYRDYINNLITRYSNVYNYAKKDSVLKLLSDKEIERRLLNLKEFNINPFKAHDYKLDNSKEIEKKVEELQVIREYIQKNYSHWNFKELLEPFELLASAKIKFSFTFRVPYTRLSLEELVGINNYICVDGKIRTLNSVVEQACYHVYNRKLAIQIKNKLEDKVSDFLKEHNLPDMESYQNCFSIEFIGVGQPNHLFTKQEIAEEMRKADDRFINQLVIDEEGYAKVIQNNVYGYLFPVRHEAWDAGGVYVGKYSNSSDLDDYYISSLQGWLLYLETGEAQNIDYIYANKNEEELVKEIKKYY